MNNNYFKLRTKHRFRKNKFDLGPFFLLNHIHTSGYFVMRVFKLNEDEYLNFYNYHLKYYLKNNEEGSEKDFLAKVIEIIDIDIVARETLHYYNKLAKNRISKLKIFRKKLKEVDKWELTFTKEERIEQSISHIKEIMNWQSINDTKSVLSKLLFDEVGSENFFL